MSTPATLLVIDGDKVDALIAALNRTADNQDRLIAGQQAAIEKIEGAKAPTTRTRKAKETEPEGNSAAAGQSDPAEPAAQTSSEQVAPSEPTSFLPSIKVGDSEALKAHVAPWLGAVAKGSDEAVARTKFLHDVAGHFGVEPKFVPLAADADRMKQFLFFFERKKAGLDVNFSADYDFDGDPQQDGGAAPADDSDFG